MKHLVATTSADSHRLLVDVVIVTYGRADLVARCLTSLSSPDIARVTRVTVVDNNSPDHTPDMIATEYPAVRLIRRDDNPGFAVANNVAIATTDAAYVLVLNPDTEITWATLEFLLDEMAADSTIGVLGCRLVLADGTFDHASKRRIPTPLDAMTYFAGRLIGRKAGRYVASDVDEKGVGEVDAVNGAFMLIRRQALDEVGGLDETYWMYGEDLDWCLRFRRAGWRVVYDGRVCATHIKGASSNARRSPKLNYEFHRSMAIFYRKNLAPNSTCLANWVVVTAIWARFGVLELKNRVLALRDRVLP